MTIINPNSISGISSITALNSTAAINLFKADGTSANIIAGVTTGANFITGTSNVHSTGYECTNINASGVTTTSKLTINSTTPMIDFSESDGNPDYRLYGESGAFVIRDQSSVANRLVINSTGVSVPNDLDVDGHTNLDNVSIAGVSTFTGQARFNGEIVAGTVISVQSGGSINIPDKLIHSGDSDTAIRFPAADTFSVETAGNEAIRIDASGRLLIGIDAVHPIGDNGNPQFLLAGTSYQTSLLGMQRFQNDAYGPTIILAHSRNASDAGHTILQDGDELGKIRFNGSDGVDFVSGGAEISVNVDGTPGTDNMPSRFIFKTTTSGQAPTEKLRIQSDGKIVMGAPVNTATGLLGLDKNITAESDVSDKNNYHLVIRSQSNSNTSKIGIAFANTTNDTHVGAAILHHRETTDSVGSLAFYTSQNPGTTSERFRITRYGELGLSGANFGTNGQVLTSGGAGQPVTWQTIVQAPTISSISASIFAGSSGQTLTIAGQHFGTAQGVINFTQSSDGVNVNVNVTPSSDTAMTVTVPSSVGNNVTAGNAVSIKFTNAAGLIGSAVNTTVLALPSGGSVTTSGNYRIHTFTSSSNFVLTKSVAIEYLVIAGGGGGGGNDGGHDHSGGSGGGGAGGHRTGTVTPSANTHTITVGGGGAGNSSAASGSDGSTSAFGGVSSVGGGGGGGVNSDGSNGRAGGSGGGAGGDDGATVYTGGAGTSGQGNAGGQTGTLSHLSLIHI